MLHWTDAADSFLKRRTRNPPRPLGHLQALVFISALRALQPPHIRSNPLDSLRLASHHTLQLLPPPDPAACKRSHRGSASTHCCGRKRVWVRLHITLFLFLFRGRQKKYWFDLFWEAQDGGNERLNIQMLGHPTSLPLAEKNLKLLYNQLSENCDFIVETDKVCNQYELSAEQNPVKALQVGSLLLSFQTRFVFLSFYLFTFWLIIKINSLIMPNQRSAGPVLTLRRSVIFFFSQYLCLPFNSPAPPEAFVALFCLSLLSLSSVFVLLNVSLSVRDHFL